MVAKEEAGENTKRGHRENTSEEGQYSRHQKIKRKQIKGMAYEKKIKGREKKEARINGWSNEKRREKEKKIKGREKREADCKLVKLPNLESNRLDYLIYLLSVRLRHFCSSLRYNPYPTEPQTIGYRRHPIPSQQHRSRISAPY
jgi:hypothetical protein